MEEMKSAYSIEGWIFVRTGTNRYDITHPSGKKWDYNHYFESVEEMIAYVKNQRK